MFSFELCLSVFLYFYTVYLLLRDSQDAKKKTYLLMSHIRHLLLSEFQIPIYKIYKTSLEFFKVWPHYLEYPAISNFLLGLMKVRDSGILL